MKSPQLAREKLQQPPELLLGPIRHATTRRPPTPPPLHAQHGRGAAHRGGGGRGEAEAEVERRRQQHGWGRRRVGRATARADLRSVPTAARAS
jgi:hypothetical protein